MSGGRDFGERWEVGGYHRQVLRPKPRSVLVLAALGSVSLLPQTAAAVCPPNNLAAFCSAAVIGDGPRLTQADVDGGAAILTSDPWVLDGTTTIVLPAGGNYSPAAPPGLGSPTIFVTDDATLRIAGAGDTGVDIDANIIVCDGGQLEVEDSALRFGSSTPLVFALGESVVRWSGATLSGAGAADVAHVLGGTAQLIGTPTASPSVRAPGGSVSVLLSDASSADIDAADAITVLRLGSAASAAVSNSSFVSVGLEVCDGDQLQLDAPPVACALPGGCFVAAHPSTDFVRPAPYAMTISNTQVYAWDVLTFPGSSIDLANVATDTNLSVTVAGDLGSATLSFPPGATPQGVDDRTIALDGVEVLGWSVDAEGTSEVLIEPGSELGSVTCRGSAMCRLEGSEVSFGPLAVREQAALSLHDTTVLGETLGAGASLEAEDSSFQAPVQVVSPVWVADTTYGAMTVGEAGVVHEVRITQPVGADVLVPGAVVEVRGTVDARDQAGPVRPMPLATLELFDVATDAVTPLTDIDAPVADDVLFAWDTDGLAPGEYELRLRFDASENAVSRRRVTVMEEGGSSSSSSGTTGATSESTGDETTGGASTQGASTGDGGSSSSSSGTGTSGPGTTGGGSEGTGEGSSGGGDEPEPSGGCRVEPNSPATGGFLGLLLVAGCVAQRRRSRPPRQIKPRPSHGEGMSGPDEQPAVAVVSSDSARAVAGDTRTAQTAAKRTQHRAVDITL